MANKTVRQEAANNKPKNTGQTVRAQVADMGGHGQRRARP